MSVGKHKKGRLGGICKLVIWLKIRLQDRCSESFSKHLRFIYGKTDVHKRAGSAFSLVSLKERTKAYEFCF